MEEKLLEYRKNKELRKNDLLSGDIDLGRDDKTEKVRNTAGNQETFSEQTSPAYGKFLIILSRLYDIQFLLKMLLWVCLLMFFVTIEFGMVYVIISGLFVMIYSMNSSQKKIDEPSAYSVFNKNFERI